MRVFLLALMLLLVATVIAVVSHTGAMATVGSWYAPLDELLQLNGG